MLRDRSSPGLSYFLLYLAEADENLPSLAEISDELGISVAGLREQLEVARALGLVEVRPRTGTRRLPFSFAPAVKQIVKYAVALNHKYFDKFAELRNHIEVAYLEEAARLLTDEDQQVLKVIVHLARRRLRGNPVQVPHGEHRRFHLLIYKNLENPFVTGLLEAYWDSYEAVGLNFYAGSIDYLEEVWRYHELIIDNIIKGDYAAAREALVEHIGLLAHRPGQNGG